MLSGCAGRWRLGWAVLLALLWARTCPAAWIFDGRPGSWEGTPEELKADEYVYPVLMLELGGAWTDFEIKASTNNFASLVYFVQSSATNAHADDTNVWVYFTDDHGTDVRRWIRSQTATAIGSQLADAVHSQVDRVLVCPSHACAVDWRGWMSRTNNRLVWSYVRFDGLNLEMNASGTKSRWNPVVPVEWRRERIAP